MSEREWTSGDELNNCTEKLMGDGSECRDWREETLDRVLNDGRKAAREGRVMSEEEQE